MLLFKPSSSWYLLACPPYRPKQLQSPLQSLAIRARLIYLSSPDTFSLSSRRLITADVKLSFMLSLLFFFCHNFITKLCALITYAYFAWSHNKLIYFSLYLSAKVTGYTSLIIPHSSLPKYAQTLFRLSFPGCLVSPLSSPYAHSRTYGTYLQFQTYLLVYQLKSFLIDRITICFWF